MSDTDDVIALEKQLWTRANDPAVYERVLADDGFSVIEPLGVVDKATAVRMAPQGQPFRDVDMRDLTVRELGRDCIAVAYHAEAHHADGKPYRGSICSVYLRRDGRWQLAVTTHQPWTPKPAAG